MVNTILAIVKKELRAYLSSSATYISVVVFLVFWLFLFFRNAFLVGDANLRDLFDFLPWLSLILVPALTMGSISKEKDDGTLEFTLTHSVKELDLVLGKFISTYLLGNAVLLMTVPLALSFSLFGKFDWGIYFAQLVGASLLLAAFISLGIFASSLLPGQIPSLLVSAALIFAFVICGTDFFLANVPLELTSIFERLSVATHVTAISRGVIDAKDLWYFVSYCGAFSSLSYLWLIKRRYGNHKVKYARFQLGVVLFVGIAVLTNVLGDKIPGRLDLTGDKLYTLAPVTRDTLARLDDVVSVTLYISDKLPAQYLPTSRDLKDILADYKNYGRGNLEVVVKDPKKDQQLTQEAQKLGVREIQFNTLGQGEFQVKTGYVGVVVSFAGKHETIPFVQSTDDIEYQLTILIRILRVSDKKTVGFLTGHGEKSLGTDYTTWNAELGKQYTVQTVTIDDKNPIIDATIGLLVIAGPTESVSAASRAAIKDYIGKGGPVMFLLDTMKMNEQTLVMNGSNNSFADFVKEFGVIVNSDTVYDLRSNETISFGNAQLSYLIPYPYWVRAGVSANSPVTSRMNGISIPWAASLQLNPDRVSAFSYYSEILVRTSKYGGARTGSVSINPPDINLPNTGTKETDLAVSLSPTSTPGSGRLVVIGSSNFMTDRFIKNFPPNLSFGLSAVSWLMGDDSIAGIGSRNTRGRVLVFSSENQVALVRYGNLALAVLFPAVIGGFVLLRRRKIGQRSYEQ